MKTQGYECTPDPEFEAVVPWLRFSPLLCSVIGAVGTFLAAPIVLFGLAVTAALGAVFPNHPFDLVYNYGLRHLWSRESLPRNRTPRQFACAVATVWLLATAIAFRMDRKYLGYALGTMFVTVSGLNIWYICVPSIVYRLLFRQPVEI